MIDPHVIRVESVRVDPMAGRAEGTLVRREACGDVTRIAFSIPGDPIWTGPQAEEALLRASCQG